MITLGDFNDRFTPSNVIQDENHFAMYYKLIFSCICIFNLRITFYVSRNLNLYYPVVRVKSISIGGSWEEVISRIAGI